MKDRVVSYQQQGSSGLRTVTRTVRYCKLCKGWHTVCADGSLSSHGSLGWACDGKTRRTW